MTGLSNFISADDRHVEDKVGSGWKISDYKRILINHTNKVYTNEMKEEHAYNTSTYSRA